MIITLLKKIPPLLSVPLFYVYISVGLLLRFLFTSTYGALILAIFYYQYVVLYTDVIPLSLEELINWLFSLSGEYKVALFTSLITISGFIIAFYTATLNWKNQLKAQLKSEAANEIERFFAVVSDNINTTSLYAESLVRIINDIQSGSSINDASFSIDYQQRRAREFLEARDILSKASVEVHRLIGKNYNLLLTGFGLLDNLNLAADSIASITKKMWIHIPIVDLKDSNHIQLFFNQVNITECNEFIKVCEIQGGKISGLIGGVRGYLLSPIWGFSFSAYINLIFKRKEFKKAMKEFHCDLNNDS